MCEMPSGFPNPDCCRLKWPVGPRTVAFLNSLISVDQVDRHATYDRPRMSIDWPSALAAPVAMPKRLLARSLHVHRPRGDQHLKRQQPGLGLPLDNDRFR